MIGLPDRWVARIPATIHTKLLVSFLGIVVMFAVLGAVGLGVLRSAAAMSRGRVLRMAEVTL